jgi:hypothetical protein
MCAIGAHMTFGRVRKGTRTCTVRAVNRRMSFAFARQSIVDYWLSHPLTDAERRQYNREYEEEMARQQGRHLLAGILHGVRVDENGKRSATGQTPDDLVRESKRCPICQGSWLWRDPEPWSLHQGVLMTAMFRAFEGSPSR